MNHAEALAATLAQLAHSRARLQGALLPPADSPPAAPRHRWRARWRWWWRHSPLAALALPWRAALAAAWHQHPWRPTADLLGGVVEQQLVPVVRRHPGWAVVAAALAGAALVHAQPWRWAPLARQASAWRSAALAGLGAHLLQPQTQSALLQALLGAVQAEAAAPPPAAEGATG